MTEPNTAIPDPDEILAGLRAAVAEVLAEADLARIDLDSLHAGTPLLSLPIDSMALMQIMTRIEDAYRVYIPESQAYEFATVGELIDFVHDKTVAKAARQRS